MIFRMNLKRLFVSLLVAGLGGPACAQHMDPAHTTEEAPADNKMVVYQMLVRLFGNKVTTNAYYGSRDENGVGKFRDITDGALTELKKLGVSHVWYTGVLEHATMTDYSAEGIRPDDPDIVKGRAGSPYAIKDYYDVDPDLAVDVRKRMAEFEDLVSRTHRHGLKVLIDFVPNHVARTYHSDAKPAGVEDFGASDDKTRAFDVKNDFYYIPGRHFVVPEGTNAGGDDFTSPLKDGRFDEFPAKATGNNVFSERPSLGDWSETIKLNYGVDHANNKTFFDPVPPVWLKMRDILVFWAGKNVDGFRCDVAEMVPVEFWSWVIPEVKKVRPDILFLAEAYNPAEYGKFLHTGKFDLLYDKVGLYDAIKRLIRNEPNADVKDITRVWKEESRGFSSRMLRFLENHDEERVASAGFAGDPWLAVPGMVVSATLSGGPVMIYFGQEVGEPGKGKEGFGGEDNRTTIFDYWGDPEHQKWMSNGASDAGQLSGDQKMLRGFYGRLLNLCRTSEAIREGRFYELTGQNGFNNRMYAFLRYTAKERLLIVANFDRAETLVSEIRIPDELGSFSSGRDLLGGQTYSSPGKGVISVKLPPGQAAIIQF